CIGESEALTLHPALRLIFLYLLVSDSYGKTMAMTKEPLIVFLYVLLLGACYAYVQYSSFIITRAAEGVALGCVVVTWMLRRSRRQCYLVDYTCYKGPDDRMLNAETSIYFGFKYQPHVADNLELQWRLYLRSGLGEETGGPSFLFKGPAEGTFEDAQVEMHECFGTLLDHLFAKTDFHPDKIDI
ncbi:hypothetical protein KI387_020985, partial [Taxus chinensis]